MLHSSDPCMPPGYMLGSLVVAPGRDIARFGSGSHVQSAPWRGSKSTDRSGRRPQEVLLSELAPMSDEGSFSHVLDIPATLKPGSYGSSAAPDSVDWCDDTGHNNRVENPGFRDSGLSAVRAACATPHVAVRVTG